MNYEHLLSGLNFTQIVLIPKKLKSECMEDFRPIVLCNLAYKVIAKVLANRMKPLLSGLIVENQYAFVLGKLIFDNIFVAFEIQHYLIKGTQGEEGYATSS